jgi:hypothetical protein
MFKKISKYSLASVVHYGNYLKSAMPTLIPFFAASNKNPDPTTAFIFLVRNTFKKYRSSNNINGFFEVFDQIFVLKKVCHRFEYGRSQFQTWMVRKLISGSGQIYSDPKKLF